VIAFIVLWYAGVPRPVWMVPALVASGGAVLLASSFFTASLQTDVATLLVTVLAFSVAAFSVPGRQAPSVPPNCEQGTSKAEIHGANDPLLTLNSFTYTLHHGKIGDWVYADLFGQISGALPTNSRLYLFAWADPLTDGVDGTKGNGLYQWLDDRQISKNTNGCWSLTGLPLGYAGYEGITVQYHPAVVYDSQTECLWSLIKAETKENGHRDGLPLDQIQKCDVNFIGHAVVPTKR
jgi:hypothetical protein